MKFPKPKVFRSRKYLDFVKSHPCCFANGCLSINMAPHHFGKSGKGMGQKCSDLETVPLCEYHHRLIHSIGWKSFCKIYKPVDFQKVAASLVEEWRESSIEVGLYTIRPHPPIPNTDQHNVIWIQKEDGEGMSLDLDKLWKDF